MPLTPVSFYFLRHGETDWNRRRMMQGHRDIPLNATGIEQAREVAPAVAKLPIATICCSTLSRAQKTADIVNTRNALVVVIDELKECGFGIYEGQDAAAQWREGWRRGEPIPGGESLAEFSARLLRGFNAALSQPGPVLIVGHGGSVWPLEKFAGITTGLHMVNCALYRFDPPTAENGPWSYTPLAEPAIPSVAIGEAQPAAVSSS